MDLESITIVVKRYIYGRDNKEHEMTPENFVYWLQGIDSC